MFHNTYQNGLLSIFFSCGSSPLAMWDMEVNNGHVKRVTDAEISSVVLEIVSTNVATTFITCPKANQVLGIRLPFLVMIVKNMKRYFSFEITVLDDKNMRRRFRISNFQSTTKIKPFCTTMPLGLSGGWNQIQFNLSDFTQRAYGSTYVETLRVQIHANTRLRRIYFSERLYTEDELPQEFKLYMPIDFKHKKEKKEKGKGDAPTKKVEPTESGTKQSPAEVEEKEVKTQEVAEDTAKVSVTAESAEAPVALVEQESKTAESVKSEPTGEEGEALVEEEVEIKTIDNVETETPAPTEETPAEENPIEETPTEEAPPVEVAE